MNKKIGLLLITLLLSIACGREREEAIYEVSWVYYPAYSGDYDPVTKFDMPKEPILRFNVVRYGRGLSMVHCPVTDTRVELNEVLEGTHIRSREIFGHMNAHKCVLFVNNDDSLEEWRATLREIHGKYRIELDRRQEVVTNRRAASRDIRPPPSP